MVQIKFKNEYKIAKIGGRLMDDYYRLKISVEYINEHFYELFCILGLLDDIDTIVEILKEDFKNLQNVYISKILREIENGNIPKDKFISQNIIKKIEALSLEEKNTIWKRETIRNLKKKYVNIVNDYLEEYGMICLETDKRLRYGLEVFGKTLFVSASRIEIDGDKFIELYRSYLAADESETKKYHLQAAEEMNIFFNGIEITQKELAKYFVLRNGIVEVNPNSVNMESYLRLGNRTIKRNKENEQKD